MALDFSIFISRSDVSLSRFFLLADKSKKQGMTDHRYFHKFHRDREMIADLYLKNDRKVIAIAIFDDRDLAIARSLVKARLKIIQCKTAKKFRVYSRFDEKFTFTCSFFKKIYIISLNGIPIKFFFKFFRRAFVYGKFLKIAQKIGDRRATIAFGSPMYFQIEIGIAILISTEDRDRDLNFGDRGHALQIIFVKIYLLCSFR